MSDKVYEMLWDCQFCGTEKLLGKTHRFCPTCGAPQNPDSRYFPSDDEKVAVEDHVFVGRDKTCASCGQLNSGGAEFCQQCGAPLDGAEQANLVQDSQVIGEGETFESTGSRDLVKEQFEAEMARVGVKKKKNDGVSGFDWRIGALIALAVLVIGGIIFALNWTQEEQVTVTGHSWSREVVIDEYQNFTTQSWSDSRPAGDDVRRGSCVEKQRGTRQIPDGEVCTSQRVDQGDGTYREVESCRTKYRSEPVYDDWCTWTGKRWEFDRDVVSSGNSVTDTPYWPDYSLNCDNQRNVGCERVSNRIEVYDVVFQTDEHEYICDFPQNEWQSIEVGSEWGVQVRVLDNAAANCDTLTRR